MSALYNEYLTGAEREAAVIIAESEAHFAKLNVLLETVDATLEANMLAAEAKVFAENGTYDDLTMLYKEAGEEADKKKQGIFATIFGAIKTFFKRIGEFFKKHFGNGEIPEKAEVPADLENNMNIFEKAWATLKSGIAKIKAGQIAEGCKELLKVVFPAALTAGVATASTFVIVKRDKIKSWVDGLKSKQQEVEDAISAAENTINTGSVVLDTVSDVAGSIAGEGDAENKSDDKQKTVGQKIAAGAKKVADFSKETAQKALALLKKFGQWILNALGKIKNWITGKSKQDDDVDETPANDEAPSENQNNVDDSSDNKGSEPNESEKKNDGTIKTTSAELKKQVEVTLSKSEKKAAINAYRKKVNKFNLSKDEQKKAIADALADKKAKANGRVSKSGALDTWDGKDEFNESVSLFGMDLDSDDVFVESTMSDEEYNELCELFNEL